MDLGTGVVILLLLLYAAVVHLTAPRWTRQAMESLARNLGLPEVGQDDPEIRGAFARRTRAREVGTILGLPLAAVPVLLLAHGDPTDQALRVALVGPLLGGLAQVVVLGASGMPARERVAVLRRREVADYVSTLHRACANLAVVPLVLALVVSVVAAHRSGGAPAWVLPGAQVVALALWLAAPGQARRLVERSFVASDVLVMAWLEGLRLQAVRELVSTRTWLTLFAAALTPFLLLGLRHGDHLTGAPATAAWVVAVLTGLMAVAAGWAELVDLGYRWYRAHGGRELPL